MSQKPPSGKPVRVDVWLWAVRIYKTRAASQKACSSGRVEIDGEQAKPARKVKIGDEIHIRLRDHERRVVVTQLIQKRVGAALATEAFDDRSPPRPERPTDNMVAPIGSERERGAGRPTKRERRNIDKLRGR